MWDIALPPQSSRMPGVSMAGFRGQADTQAGLRMVPYPALTVFLDFGDATVVEDAVARPLTTGVVVGLAVDEVQWRGQDADCLQIRMSPLVAHAVLGASSELGGTVVSLEDLWGHDAERIQEQMHAAPAWDDRFAIAKAAVARRQEEGRAVDPEVAFAWQRMVASNGRVRVERLAAEVGWSRKRLWSRFRSQVGLAPKHAARLVRFDHAAHRLAAGHSAALVAAEGGYVDQSHLHRDVMTFAGVTPTGVAVAPWLAVDDVAWATPQRAPRS